MLCSLKNLTNLADPEINEFPDLYQVPKENENPQRRYQFNSQDSLLVQNIPTLEKNYIAPGERRSPNSLLTDESCELLAFPYLFPTGKFGCNVQRDIKLSPVTYSSKLCAAICI